LRLKPEWLLTLHKSHTVSRNCQETKKVSLLISMHQVE
jgi:hypothetical protein